MSEEDPPHPGALVRARCLTPHELTVAGGARLLGVTRQALNNLVNGKAGLSPDMAIRIAKVFGEDEESWLQMQLAYDLAQARRRAATIIVPSVAKRPHFNKEPRPL